VYFEGESGCSTAILTVGWLVRTVQQRTLKKVHSLFQDFVEQASAGISVANEEGRIIFWNLAMELATGLSVDDVLGRMIWDVYFNLLPPECKPLMLWVLCEQNIFLS